MTRRQLSNVSLQRVLLATTMRLHNANSHVATIKYHMHYPIFMACTGGAVISLTSYPYTVWTRVSCQAVSPMNGLGTRLGRYVYGSYTYREGCSSMGQTPYENLSSDNVGFWVLSVPWQTHWQLLHALQGMHAPKLWNLQLPPLTTCTAYLHMICCILTHALCHFHTRSVSYCKTIMQDHVTQLR